MARFPMFPGCISLCWLWLSLYLNMPCSLKLVKVTRRRSSFSDVFAGKICIEDPCKNLRVPG